MLIAIAGKLQAVEYFAEFTNSSLFSLFFPSLWDDEWRLVMLHFRQVNERCGGSRTPRCMWRRQSARQAATNLHSNLYCITPLWIAACIASSPVVVSPDREIHSSAQSAYVMPFGPCPHLQLPFSPQHYRPWCFIELPMQRAPRIQDWHKNTFPPQWHSHKPK